MDASRVTSRPLCLRVVWHLVLTDVWTALTVLLSRWLTLLTSFPSRCTLGKLGPKAASPRRHLVPSREWPPCNLLTSGPDRILGKVLTWFARVVCRCDLVRTWVLPVAVSDRPRDATPREVSAARPLVLISLLRRVNLTNVCLEILR